MTKAQRKKLDVAIARLETLRGELYMIAELAAVQAAINQLQTLTASATNASTEKAFESGQNRLDAGAESR